MACSDGPVLIVIQPIFNRAQTDDRRRQGGKYMPRNLSSILRSALLCSIALLFVFCAQSFAQDSSKEIQQIPINPLLKNHTNWFDPVKIYDLKQDHYPLPDANYPKDIKYEVYSAVGYDLANTMIIKGPKTNSKGQREVII